MKGARILVLGVALAAGGAAAYMMRSEEAAPVAPAPVVKIDLADVLVAKGDIGIGQNITKDELKWESWPAAAAGPFIKKSDRPAAIEQIAGSVARTPFVGGEPIREDKLIKANGSGYMAAVLPTGMRAISTAISPETGAGGFILPNDRVDVILIRSQKGTPGEAYSSETILTNVRVLAIDQTVEEKNGQRVVVGKVATLALNSRDSETLALAGRLGTLSLVLRSLADTQADSDDANRNVLGGRDSINVIRFSGFRPRPSRTGACRARARPDKPARDSSRSAPPETAASRATCARYRIRQQSRIRRGSVTPPRRPARTLPS
jgi:pilus assembly protein CpaB